ncbi:MAG: hypothetical protein WCH44_03710 [Betaproteobacteria bacterium]
MAPPCVAFGASPQGGQHQRSGKAGSAVFAGVRWWFIGAMTKVLLACCLILSGFLVNAAAASGVPQPVIEAARGGKCPADPAFMRRNHMELLKHQRDETLRAGARQGKFSLKACIACHASQKTNSVAAAGTNFCQSCHAYAAVQIDCFECHASQAQARL